MKCTFCGSEIARGTGKIYVPNATAPQFFCSNTCEKQLHKLKRKPENVKWTESYKKAKAVRMHTKEKGKEAKK